MKQLWTILTAFPLYMLGLVVKACSVFKAPHPLRGPMMRMKVRDIAYAYRMGAGFPGDVNRTHPAGIEPALINTTYPPDQYGQAVLADANTGSVRRLIATDTAVTDIYGVTVRPNPIQQASASNYGAATMGAAVPPTTGIIDVLKEGYIIGKVPAGAAAKKGGQVFVWVAADSGSHVHGGFEAVVSGGNTCSLANAKFNGVPDAEGNVEIVISPARN